MPSFLPTRPSDEDYWRGIVLLGRNVATYKPALVKSLLELARSVIKLAALTGGLVLLISFLLIACTSDTEETLLSKPSTSESSSVAVPEKEWAMTNVLLRARWDPTCTGDEISGGISPPFFGLQIGQARAQSMKDGTDKRQKRLSGGHCRTCLLTKSKKF